MKLTAKTYSERMEEACAAAGRPELAETLTRLSYGERAVIGLIRNGEIDRILAQSGAAPSKAAEPTDDGWSKAIAEVNARIG